MSRMITRVGPVIVGHSILTNGKQVSTISDPTDENLYMVFEDMPLEDAIAWAVDYVRTRYVDGPAIPLIGLTKVIHRYNHLSDWEIHHLSNELFELGEHDE